MQYCLSLNSTRITEFDHSAQGGKLVMDPTVEATEATEKDKEYGLMMADFDHDKEQVHHPGDNPWANKWFR